MREAVLRASVVPDAPASVVAPMRRALKGRAPGLRLERRLWEAGNAVVAGVDEVGRGSWAGPLTVAAVVADPERRIYKVRDSKMLTAAEREALYDRILAWAAAASVGHATVDECAELGMADAQRLAARRAVDGLGLAVDHVLVDGTWNFLAPPRDSDARADDGRRADGHGVTMIVRGDASSLSIAAASVLAKVTRDRIMAQEAGRYPGYWFASNKGYPCPRHKAALAAWGPCAIHRRRWVFMEGLRWTAVPRIQPPPDDSQLRLFGPASKGDPASEALTVPGDAPGPVGRM